MKILETERLIIREMNADMDAAFIFELLNTPKFIKFIGDRGVRSIEKARDFIDNRYRRSYRDHGYGLYTVELKEHAKNENNTLLNSRVPALTPVGICGFVKRKIFEHPDIGFAFLPQWERKGYGFESAQAVMKYGRDLLGFERVLAITSQDNEASGRLLEKIGFAFDRLIEMPDGEVLKLYSSENKQAI